MNQKLKKMVSTKSAALNTQISDSLRTNHPIP